MLSLRDPKSGSTSGGDRPRKRDRELARLGGHNDGNLAACENPDGSSGGLRSGAKFRGIDPGNRKRLRHASSATNSILIVYSMDSMRGTSPTKRPFSQNTHTPRLCPWLHCTTP